MRQRAGTEQYVPTSAVHPAPFSRLIIKNDGRRAPNNKMNKERFHNQLALNLGYKRIVNDKIIDISIDDKQCPDDVVISIRVNVFPSPICYKASEGLDQNDMDCLDENGYDDIKMIVDAVHQAYIESCNKLF